MAADVAQCALQAARRARSIRPPAYARRRRAPGMPGGIRQPDTVRRGRRRSLNVTPSWAYCALCGWKLRTACFHDTPERGGRGAGSPQVKVRGASGARTQNLRILKAGSLAALADLPAQN